MTPGTYNVPIYKGAQYKWGLHFIQPVTGDSIDLTGLAPFVFTVSDPVKNRILLTGTVDEIDLSDGRIDITLTPDETATLNLGNVRMGLRDALGNPYIASTIPVLFFSPDPP